MNMCNAFHELTSGLSLTNGNESSWRCGAYVLAAIISACAVSESERGKQSLVLHHCVKNLSVARKKDWMASDADG